MHRIRKFILLPAAERRLLLASALLLVAVRIGTWLLPFRLTRRVIDRFSAVAPTRRREAVPADRVAWCVANASRALPGTGNCLVRANVTRILLARRGYASELRIGVTRDKRGEFAAHAWIEWNGQILIGGEGAPVFTPLPSLEQAT